MDIAALRPSQIEQLIANISDQDVIDILAGVADLLGNFEADGGADSDKIYMAAHLLSMTPLWSKIAAEQLAAVLLRSDVGARAEFLKGLPNDYAKQVSYLMETSSASDNLDYGEVFAHAAELMQSRIIGYNQSLKASKATKFMVAHHYPVEVDDEDQMFLSGGIGRRWLVCTDLTVALPALEPAAALRHARIYGASLSAHNVGNIQNYSQALGGYKVFYGRYPRGDVRFQEDHPQQPVVRAVLDE